MGLFNLLEANQNEVVKENGAASLTYSRRQLLAISDAILNLNIKTKTSTKPLFYLD